VVDDTLITLVQEPHAIDTLLKQLGLVDA